MTITVDGSLVTLMGDPNALDCVECPECVAEAAILQGSSGD